MDIPRRFLATQLKALESSKAHISSVFRENGYVALITYYYYFDSVSILIYMHCYCKSLMNCTTMPVYYSLFCRIYGSHSRCGNCLVVSAIRVHKHHFGMIVGPYSMLWQCFDSYTDVTISVALVNNSTWLLSVHHSQIGISLPVPIHHDLSKYLLMHHLRHLLGGEKPKVANYKAAACLLSLAVG